MVKKKVISKVKKKITEFLLSEDGKVSKSDIIKAGVVVVASSAMLTSDAQAAAIHTNNVNFEQDCCVRHGNHNSHSSHSSY